MGSPIKGTIKDINFIQLLKEVAESKLTGMIRIEKGPIIKVVYIQQGGVAFASSNEKSDRLTEVLKRAGKLTTEQIDDAQVRLKPNVSLGKTLVELGYISPKDLLWGARSQVEGILHQLLFWTEGNYQILEGPLPKEIVSLGLPIVNVLFDGVQRTQDRDWVLEQIVSPQAIYELTSDFHSKYSLMKLPAEAVVSRINGKRPLEDIAQNAGMDTFEVCKTVAALQILGLVQRVQEAVQMPVNAALEQEEPAIEAGSGEVVESNQLSLGQMLHVPTVEELQEPDDEEVASTMISAPPVTVEIQREEPQEPLPGAEVQPHPTYEDNEEADEPMSFLESSSVAEMPAERTVSPSFGSLKHHRPRGPRQGINWRKLALWTALFAALALGALKLYNRQQRSVYLSELTKLTAPIKAPPNPHKPSLKSSEPVAVQPAETQPSTTAPAKEPVEAPAKPPMTTPAIQPTAKPPVETKKPPATTPAIQPTAKPPVETKKPPVSQPPAQKPPEPAPATKETTPLQLLQGGKLAEAANGWLKELGHARSKYTIQLEIACQPSTVQEAAGVVDASNLLVIPINYHGQACYRILYGTYATENSAEQARAGLPSIFLKQEAPARVVPVSKLLP